MSADQPAAARIVARTSLHAGFLKVNRYTFEVPKHAGGTHFVDLELMERGNAVAVLAYDLAQDQIVLGNEFRPGAMVSGDYPFRDQLFAGGLDPGESLPEAAARELREEAGLVLHKPRIIHPGLYVSSGGTSEKIALVFGLVDARAAHGAIHGNDPKEDVLSVVMPALQFIQRVRDGAVDDCKTLIAGMWFAQHREAIRQQG